VVGRVGAIKTAAARCGTGSGVPRGGPGRDPEADRRRQKGVRLRVVDAIKSVIDWLKKIKLPRTLIGKIGAPSGASSGRASQCLERGGAGGARGELAGHDPRRGPGGTTTVNVFVPEASDPVATARYLKALIRRGEAAGVLFGTT
jgi:hypothetical protein